MAKTRLILGVMSGSSLDGLDMALCRFSSDGGNFVHEVVATGQAFYEAEWLDRLRQVHRVDVHTFFSWNYEYGAWLGKAIAGFAETTGCIPELVVVHGHTVFHQPDAHYSIQLGHGAAISAQCSLPVMCDVRSADLALGGQGAPLAHLADLYLYPGYVAYLNLGGIANITLPSTGKAWDLAGANQLLNALAGLVGKAYDDRGMLAESGKVIPELLARLSADDFLSKEPPKSLDNQYVTDHFTRILLDDPHPVEDRLATATEHIAEEVVRSLVRYSIVNGKILITGGGAYNDFLIRRFMEHSVKAGLKVEWIIPEARILEYKEAILMALMGYLRIEQRANCVPTFTGASGPSSNGALYQTIPSL